MRVLLINSVCGIGSTGKICGQLAEEFESHGDEVRIAYGRSDTVPDRYKKYAVKIGNKADLYYHAVLTRLDDAQGLGSKEATRKFLKWADSFNPDLLWLHNIHGYYINIELLFAWIKSRPDMQVKWTLHDCWAFTGHCSHFTFAKCYKWKTECNKCPQYRNYPASLTDHCTRNYRLKKELFTGIKNCTIIVPSHWLENLVKQSFLREYPIEVHYNEIDHTVFKPTPSDFRKRYGLEDKTIVLAVSNIWGERKGLYDILELGNLLGDGYAIVIVGLTPKQIDRIHKKYPKYVVLPKTNNQYELAKVYSASDIFVNPSKEETFGLTTVESLACGAKAITYKGTAGEEIADAFGGVSVEPDAGSLVEAIRKIGGGGNHTTAKDVKSL